MEEKKNYEKPEVEVIEVEGDITLASGEIDFMDIPSGDD